MIQYSQAGNGSSIAVKGPSKGVVYAPADAGNRNCVPNRPCLWIKTDNGAKILIHVGIDTVSMNGEGFEAKVSQGDRVESTRRRYRNILILKVIAAGMGLDEYNNGHYH